jgi:hypothetical protein
MWALAPSAIKHAEYTSLGPQNATGPSIALIEIAKSNPSNVHEQTNTLLPPQSPQPISPSQFSGDHTHHDIKYLEQLLDSSLADILTPRAYNTFKALYALAALDAQASSTEPRGSEIPTRSTSSDIGNDDPSSNNRSPPLPNSSLAVPRTGRIHISFSVDYVLHFSWARLAAVACLVAFFSLPRLCERIFRMDYLVHFSWARLAAVACLVVFISLPRFYERIFRM